MKTERDYYYPDDIPPVVCNHSPARNKYYSPSVSHPMDDVVDKMVSRLWRTVLGLIAFGAITAVMELERLVPLQIKPYQQLNQPAKLTDQAWKTK
jgi:hypothetical protein